MRCQLLRSRSTACAQAAIRDDTALVSIMAINNEIGVMQPLAEIGALCRKRGVFFHTDAAQAAGKVPLDVNALNIDAMSISGHKVSASVLRCVALLLVPGHSSMHHHQIYGPKGVGAIYLRRRPRVRLEPIINGGGQERGLRSGTVPTPLVVSFARLRRVICSAHSLSRAGWPGSGVRRRAPGDGA